MLKTILMAALLGLILPTQSPAAERFDFVLAKLPFNANAFDTAMRVSARRQPEGTPQDLPERRDHTGYYTLPEPYPVFHPATAGPSRTAKTPSIPPPSSAFRR